MARRDQVLYPASFKGVNFVIDGDAEVTGGRKTVTHEYPNSPNRITEDLGLMPKTYNLTCIIHGNDYVERSQAFENALDTGGMGVLIHPFRGSLDVVSKTWTLIENQNSLGKAEYKVTFEEQKGILNPTPLDVTASQLNDAKNLLRGELSCDLLQNYSLLKTSISTYQATKSKLFGIADKFNEQQNTVVSRVLSVSQEIEKTARNVSNQIITCIRFIGTIPAAILAERDDLLSKANDTINNFRDNVNTLVREPQRLAQSLESMWDNIEVVAKEAIDQFRLLEGFFDFGDEDIEVKQTTNDRKQRVKNLKVLNQNIQINALASAYNTISQIKFKNEDELNSIRRALEVQFQKAKEFDLSTDTRRQLLDLRQKANRFLDNEFLRVDKIVTTNVKELPSGVISFMYYGNSDRDEEIVNLNNSFNPAFLEGDIRILTNE